MLCNLLDKIGSTLCDIKFDLLTDINIYWQADAPYDRDSTLAIEDVVPSW